MLRKKDIFLSSQNYACHQYVASQHKSPNPLHDPTRQDELRSPLSSAKLTKSQRRQYATVTPKETPRRVSNELYWPQLASATAIPTPYQIFQQSKTAPYSKCRFYELVKLYHPDRHVSESLSSEIYDVPLNVKIERYRLIVAANGILSDPEKRAAYDKHGLGWHDSSEKIAHKHRRNHDDSPCWFDYHSSDSPLRNATWEDWEKWYQRNNQDKDNQSKDSQSKQEQVYLSHGGFVTLLVIFCAIGAIGQAKRIGYRSSTLLEQIEARNGKCRRNIENRKRLSQKFYSDDQRLDNFLKAREPYSSETVDP